MVPTSPSRSGYVLRDLRPKFQKWGRKKTYLLSSRARSPNQVPAPPASSPAPPSPPQSRAAQTYKRHKNRWILQRTDTGTGVQNNPDREGKREWMDMPGAPVKKLHRSFGVLLYRHVLKDHVYLINMLIFLYRPYYSFILSFHNVFSFFPLKRESDRFINNNKKIMLYFTCVPKLFPRVYAIFKFWLQFLCHSHYLSVFRLY